MDKSWADAVVRSFRSFGIPIGVLVVLLTLRKVPPYVMFSESSLLVVGPLLCLFAVDRARILPSRVLVHLSPLLFLVAMCLPAITLGGTDLRGVWALLSNFEFFKVMLAEPGQGELWYLLACLLGVTANLCWGVALFARSRRLALIAACASIAVLVPLSRGELHGVYLGHGLWLASQWCLALGLSDPLAKAPSPMAATGARIPRAVWLSVSLTLAVSVVAVVGWQEYKNVQTRREYENRDHAAREASRQFIAEQLLAARWPELTQRYGVFRGLSDQRPVDRDNWPEDIRTQVLSVTGTKILLFSATARFDRTSCKVLVKVTDGPAVRVERIQVVDGQPPGLVFFVRHPALYDRQDELSQITPVAEDFVDAVLRGDESRALEARQRYEQIVDRLNGVEDVFLAYLDDPSPQVRRRVLNLLARANRRIHYPYGPEYGPRLLAVVRDSQEPQAVREAAVDLLLRWGQWQELVGALETLGEQGSFAIPVIAAFLTDRSLSHWSVPGASSAPTRLVELLPRLGPRARELVPPLRASLDHPNRWDYVPSVARVLEQLESK